MAMVNLIAPKSVTRQPCVAAPNGGVCINEDAPEYLEFPSLLESKPVANYSVVFDDTEPTANGSVVIDDTGPTANGSVVLEGDPPDWPDSPQSWDETFGRQPARFKALVTALVAEHERVIQCQELEKRQLLEQFRASWQGEETGGLRFAAESKSDVHSDASAVRAKDLRRCVSEVSRRAVENRTHSLEGCGDPVLGVKSGKSGPSNPHLLNSDGNSDGRKRIRAMEAVQNFRQSSMAEMVLAVDWMTKLKRFLETDQFEISIMMVIFFNIVVTAVELQYLGSNTGRDIGYTSYDDGVNMVSGLPYEAMFRVVDHSVLAIFTVELVLRLTAQKLEYLKRASNWVDVVIVVTGLMDSLWEVDTMNLEHLRLLRGLKLARIARGFRLFKMPKVFDCLRVLVEAIKASKDALLWSVGVLFAIHCVMALLMTQLVYPYLTDDGIDIERRRRVFKYYGTFTRSLITMFEIMLANWSPPVRVIIEDMGQLYGLPILFYRCVAGFAVLNVVNAVFIQQTIQVAQSDTEIMIMEKKRARLGYEKKLRAFFHKLDASGDGVLSFDEFRGIVDDPLLRSWLDALGIDPNHLREFFDLLDNGDGEITVDEFITGASRVRGQAQSIDMAYLVHHSRRVEGIVNNTYDTLRRFVSELQVEFPPAGPK